MKSAVRKKQQVEKTKHRIRAKLLKSNALRLAFFRGNRNFYAQIIDDQKGITLVAAATNEKSFRPEGEKNMANIETAKKLGQLIAERAKEKNIEKVVFDRSGRIYHGKVKAFADSAREGGLQF